MQVLKASVASQCNPILGGLKAAFIHSTTASHAKWRNKWGSDVHGSRDSSKDYSKYAKRQKRAEAKRTLRELHSMSMSPEILSQEGVRSWNAWKKINVQTWSNENSRQNFNKQAHSKGKTKHKASTNHSTHGTERVKDHRRRKRKNKGPQFYSNDGEDDEKVFEVLFGGRCVFRSFSNWSDLRWRASTWEFKWRGNSNWRSKVESDNCISDDESPSVGSASDRITLGLAPHGPLKLEDVKQAFRMSALKWHPDRNQGPSKVIAEEKFKRCGVAYKSLCDAFVVE